MPRSPQSIPLLILAALALLSCSKEGLPDPPPCSNCNNTDTLLVWSKDIDTTSGTHFLFANPVLHRGHPIFAVHKFSGCEYGSAHRITSYEAGTGEKRWGINTPNLCANIRNLYVYEDYLIVNMPREVLAYNVLDQSLLWTLPIPDHLFGSTGFQGIGDKVYLSIGYMGSSAWAEESSLYEIDVYGGTYREICRFSRSEWGGYPVVHPPSLWIEPGTGDSLLMIAVGLYEHHKGPMAARHSLHAYDLKTNTYRWQVDSIGIPTNNNRRVEVYEDKVYILTDYRVQCFNAFNGAQIWEYTLKNYTQYVSSFLHSRLLATKGKVIANPTGDDMYCLDAQTGQLMWSVNKYTASANHDLIEHNGVVYLSSGGNGRLVGVDLESGQVLLSIRSPNGSPTFSGYNVIINKEKNLLFLNSFRRAYAYRPVR